MPAAIFTRLSVFDSPKGSSDTFKAHKNISLYFKRRHLIIYTYFDNKKKEFKTSFICCSSGDGQKILKFNVPT